MRRGLYLSLAVALVALCSASSPLPGSGPARNAAAATDPVSNPQPASTLLAPGTTALDLSVDSAVATDCAWSLGTAKEYSAMTRFSSGAGNTSHSTSVTGLDPSPAVLNRVYVRCASNPSFALALEYRSLGRANPSFPRTGNLWGWWDIWKKSPTYLARTDLWVAYGDVNEQRIRAIRKLNPNVLVLNSINAVEESGLPEDWYLHDIHGKKIEVWPNDYRLNLTKPEVADYQAHAAYDLLLKNHLICDGMFFDNVMTTQSWQKTDIYGNPFVVDANNDGKADDLTVFDAAWKAGVFREIREFRRLMPHALVIGHSMNIQESGIAQLFNGLSIGFRPADVLEQELSFDSLFEEYRSWMTDALKPHITMFEASPPDQIAYGYDYSPWKKIPASTLEFARTLYPYMRFGFGTALMNDGYFAYEYGDTWHGNDWWYDELNFNLGHPRGAGDQGGRAGERGSASRRLVRAQQDRRLDLGLLGRQHERLPREHADRPLEPGRRQVLGARRRYRYRGRGLAGGPLLGQRRGQEGEELRHQLPGPDERGAPALADHSKGLAGLAPVRRDVLIQPDPALEEIFPLLRVERN